MYTWYERANTCFAYFSDVPDTKTGLSAEGFRASRWWTRGWTVWELITPMCLEFYAADWSKIGTKLERKKEISEITRIQEKVLDKSRHFSDCCAAEIVSWAARRERTKEEDQSHALIVLLK
jgi:hypothetical protein